MRLLLAANNQATRRNEIIKSYLQLGSSSNRYAPRLPQQETKSSTKQLPPTDPILGPENLLKTGFAQKGLPSTPTAYPSWRKLRCTAWPHQLPNSHCARLQVKKSKLPPNFLRKQTRNSVAFQTSRLNGLLTVTMPRDNSAN